MPQKGQSASVSVAGGRPESKDEGDGRGGWEGEEGVLGAMFIVLELNVSQVTVVGCCYSRVY